MMTPRNRAFTVIEFVVALTVVILLSSLILAAAGYIQTKGKRSQAEVEIAAITAALENYRVDNGTYPSNLDTAALNPAMMDPNAYRSASVFLYSQLTGDDDANPLTSAPFGSRNYFNTGLRPNMLAPNPPGPNTYLQDPFGHSYGYSTAKAENPNGSVGINPTFDLWSTGNSTDPSQWIKNW
jgi:type II secretory pathway pseudopilin PulG